MASLKQISLIESKESPSFFCYPRPRLILHPAAAPRLRSGQAPGRVYVVETLFFMPSSTRPWVRRPLDPRSSPKFMVSVAEPWLRLRMTNYAYSTKGTFAI